MKIPSGYYSEVQCYVGHEVGFRYRFKVIDDATIELQYQEGCEGGWQDRGTAMSFGVDIADAIAETIVSVAASAKESE